MCFRRLIFQILREKTYSNCSFHLKLWSELWANYMWYRNEYCNILTIMARSGSWICIWDFKSEANQSVDNLHCLKFSYQNMIKTKLKETCRLQYFDGNFSIQIQRANVYGWKINYEFWSTNYFDTHNWRLVCRSCAIDCIYELHKLFDAISGVKKQPNCIPAIDCLIFAYEPSTVTNQLCFSMYTIDGCMQLCYWNPRLEGQNLTPLWMEDYIRYQ